MTFDVVIVGGGPGGLACAEHTAAHGLSTLVLERKELIGEKVCAGGITWNGLMQKVSGELAERSFQEQYVYTRRQQACIRSDTPIIATVNRARLGSYMADKACKAGAVVHRGCQVTEIRANSIRYRDKRAGKEHELRYRYLVGSDGSASLVRRFLGVKAAERGIGINYQLAGYYPKMEWHLDPVLFGSGYGWVFPHKESISVGAYAEQTVMAAKTLKENLVSWGEAKGFQLTAEQPRAEYINFDFQGYRFGNIFLVGDAAGLASGLTGEGIYPAIISGESVAKMIVDPGYDAIELKRLIKNHARHRKMVLLAGKNKLVGVMLAELVTFCLKKQIIDFSAAEMAC